jgi:hypothetical protein
MTLKLIFSILVLLALMIVSASASTLSVKDSSSTVRYVAEAGSGTAGDPFVPYHKLNSTDLAFDPGNNSLNVSFPFLISGTTDPGDSIINMALNNSTDAAENLTIYDGRELTNTVIDKTGNDVDATIANAAGSAAYVQPGTSATWVMGSGTNTVGNMGLNATPAGALAFKTYGSSTANAAYNLTVTHTDNTRVYITGYRVVVHKAAVGANGLTATLCDGLTKYAGADAIQAAAVDNSSIVMQAEFPPLMIGSLSTDAILMVSAGGASVITESTIWGYKK